MYRYRRVLSCRWFPVPTMLFVSPFVLVHLLLLSGLSVFAAGLPAAGLPLLALAFALPLCLGWKSTLRRLTWQELGLYAGVAYIINWTCILASLAAGLRERRIFVYPGI